jgi:hypothetical protein
MHYIFANNISFSVLVFSQSLLSLDLIEHFLQVNFAFCWTLNSLHQRFLFFPILQKIDTETAMAKSKPKNGGDGPSEESPIVSYLGNWQSGKDYFRMDGSTAPETRQKCCNYFNKVRF